MPVDLKNQAGFAAAPGSVGVPRDLFLFTELCKGQQSGDHKQNFFEWMVDRFQPISVVHPHLRAMTSCHLANTAIRLNCKLEWDPESAQIADDPAPALRHAREQRQGIEVEV